MLTYRSLLAVVLSLVLVLSVAAACVAASELRCEGGNAGQTQVPRQAARPSVARAARGAAATARPRTIPRNFSWTSVSASDARAWEREHARQLPAGTFASSPVNQHALEWCGACWLVAALQVVQDMLNIRESPANPHDRDHRAFVFDLQRAAEDVTRIHAPQVLHSERVGVLVGGERPRAWTACMGGDPKVALEAMLRGTLRVHLLSHGRPSLTGVAPGSGARDEVAAGEAPSVRAATLVRDIEQLPLDVAALKRRVWRGPVVVAVSSASLWDLDAQGRVRREAPRGERDHVMACVGWRRVGGVECFVMRNSWGDATTNFIHTKPVDVRACTGGGQCAKTPRVAWSSGGGEGGFVFVPTDLRANAARVFDEPSGWLAVTV